MEHLLTDAAFWVAILGLATYFLRKASEDRSINKAIEAEVHRLMEVLERHRDFWQRCINNQTTAHHPLIPFNHVVYDMQVKNIGVIRRREVDAVVRFYGYIDYVNRFQALRKDYEKAGYAAEFHQMYVDLLSRLLVMFKSSF